MSLVNDMRKEADQGAQERAEFIEHIMRSHSEVVRGFVRSGNWEALMHEYEGLVAKSIYNQHLPEEELERWDNIVTDYAYMLTAAVLASNDLTAADKVVGTLGTEALIALEGELDISIFDDVFDFSY
jgi:hypothetical protein